MSEYSWPDDGAEVGTRARAAWAATCEALPVGTPVTGEVIGRRPFGVFLRIDGVPDAVGLAEITAMPHGPNSRTLVRASRAKSSGVQSTTTR
ncbi:S1 domain-containing protein [Streptomyces nojiriensis]|uniref:hypothetical protein n=1 Tax=Streptomyces nojiriensis TaxID=66374 RepID=UPI0036470707